MPYLNSWRRALVAMALLVSAASGLHAQEASVATGTLRGDVDGDGRVTRADADAVRAYLVRGTVPAGRSILPAGDANGDGRVTAADAALISRFAAGLDVSRFPVGRPVDGGRGGEGETSGAGALQTGDQLCTVDLEVGTSTCREVLAGGTSVQNVILGDPYVSYLTTTTHRKVNPANEDTTLYTVAIKNETPQPLGTTDGENPAAGGIRLFMTEGPTVLKKVSGSGATSIRLELADGTATFTNQDNTVTFTNRLYFQYDEVLAPEATSAPDSLRFVYSSNVIRFSYAYRVSAPVQFEHGWITVAPATPPIIGPGQTTPLTATVFNQVGVTQADAVTWSSSDTGVATVNSSTGVVTGVAGGTATITATSNVNGQRIGSRAVQVIQAVPDVFSTTTTGNVRINSASTSPVFTVLTNDVLHGASIVSAGWGATPNKTQNGGDVVMNLGTGTFTYNPPAGFEGADSLEYTIQVGTATSTGRVALPVSGMIWFVRNGAAACTSRAAAEGCGRLTNPYSSLNAFRDENNGTGNNPGAGDAIFLYESATPYTLTGTPLSLQENQKLVGQDAGASLSAITGITPATGSDALPGMNPGADAVTIAGGVGGVVLGANNLLRGFGITTTGGTALGGSNFGTPNIAEVPVSATGGAAISLDNGTLNSTFSNVSSTNSTGRGISLTNVNGTPTFSAGSISGAAQAALFVSGGNVGFTWPGNIGQANNAPLVDVQGSHTGALVFSGGLTATNGSGLQFNAAQGTYTFNGNTTLGGNDAGVDITNGSGGTFTFGNNTAISNLTGTGVNVYGSAATVTYSGNITKSGTSTGRLVEIGEQTGGTVTFNTGTLLANSTSNLSTGISLSNADGAVNFNGTVTLSGGDAGVDIVSGSSGAIAFGSSTAITNPSGEALRIFNGSGGDQPANVTFAGSITTNAGRPVLIEDVSSGTVAVSASINATAGLGIAVQNNSGGTFTFSNATQSLSTAGNAAVSLANNTGATMNFTGGSLVITTGAGAGFSATGGGTVTVQGASNTINSTGGGTAVNISGTTIGGSGVTFFRVNATGSGTNGIVLSNTGAGSFEVTGDGASDPNNTTRGRTTAKAGGGTVALGSGGTISGRSGHGVSLSSTGPVTLRNMAITGSASSGDGINASSTGRLTVDNTRITGHASDHGILGNSVSGFALHHSEVDNNGTTVGVVEGPDIWNVRLLGLTGTDSIRNSNIHHSQENVLGIINTSGVLNLTVMNTNITDTGTGAGGTSAFMLAANGSSNVTLNLQNDSINRGRSRGLQIGTEATSSAVLNLTVNNSQFHQNGASIDLSHGSSGTNTFSITNNNLQAGTGSLQALSVNRAAAPGFNSFGLFTGTISGNTIGTAGTASSGSDTGSGIEVESNGSGGITRVAVVNNTIREVANHGIYVAAVDGNLGGTAPPLLEARVAGNTISNLEPVIGLDGIHVLSGALNTDDVTICVDIANNNSTAVRNGLRVRGSGVPTAPATVQLEGWDGVTARSTYFASRPNTLVGGVAAYNDNVPSAPGGYVAVANCNTP